MFISTFQFWGFVDFFVLLYSKLNLFGLWTVTTSNLKTCKNVFLNFSYISFTNQPRSYVGPVCWNFWTYRAETQQYLLTQRTELKTTIVHHSYVYLFNLTSGQQTNHPQKIFHCNHTLFKNGLIFFRWCPSSRQLNLYLSVSVSLILVQCW